MLDQFKSKRDKLLADREELEKKLKNATEAQKKSILEQIEQELAGDSIEWSRVTMTENYGEATVKLLEEIMGFQRVSEAGNRIRFQGSSGGPGAFLDLVVDPATPHGHGGRRRVGDADRGRLARARPGPGARVPATRLARDRHGTRRHPALAAARTG